MPSQQALSACREGILRYFSNFQYPLRSEPMRSIKPFSLSIFNLSDTVFRLRDRFSARKVVVYAGSMARRSEFSVMSHPAYLSPYLLPFLSPCRYRTDDPIFRCGEFDHNIAGLIVYFRLRYAVLSQAEQIFSIPGPSSQ